MLQVAIKVWARDEAKALDILLRHSTGMALPDRIFVVSADAVRALRKAGVRLRELARNGDWSGVGKNGKRI